MIGKEKDHYEAFGGALVGRSSAENANMVVGRGGGRGAGGCCPSRVCDAGRQLLTSCPQCWIAFL